MNTNRILLVVLLASLSIPIFRARAADNVDGVTVKNQEVYEIQGDKLDPLTQNLKLAFDVEVSTNGTFKVGDDGKERQIQEGQVVRNDGWLLNPNGSVEPVFDHVAMKNGRVYVVRDGESSALSKEMTFPNGMTVNPEGYGSNLPDGRIRLQDGQLFHLDGTPIQAKDTISMKNGRVVVQKSGTLIPLSSVQIMGMDNGTRVRGDGTIWKRDGTTFQLKEGQTILVEGAKYSR